MFQNLRKHLTPSTAIAFIALVFALTGGAFAATGGSGSGASHATLRATAAKSKGKTGPRGPRGPAGPAGKNGVPGAAGPAGAAGPKGENGSAGGTGAQGPPGLEGKPGKEGKEGEEGTPGTAGKEGSPWTAGGTLPSGSTETGAWSATLTPTGTGTVEAIVMSPISFPIRLAVPILGFAAAGPSAHYVSTEEQAKGGPEATECKGNVEKPEAAKGNLCIYEGAILEPSGTEYLAVSIVTPPSGSIDPGGTGTAGALMYVRYEGPAGEARLSGSWAVTAP
jgi:Collagen triple helix repeat (20 copies)